jgi:hypothetical protein
MTPCNPGPAGAVKAREKETVTGESGQDYQDFFMINKMKKSRGQDRNLFSSLPLYFES